MIETTVYVVVEAKLNDDSLGEAIGAFFEKQAAELYVKQMEVLKFEQYLTFSILQCPLFLTVGLGAQPPEGVSR